MESKETAAQQLRELERAEAAPYVDYPPTPWWHHPVVGTWTAAMTAYLYKTLVDDWSAPWSGLVLVLLVVGEVLYLTWYTRYRGAMPAFGKSPGMPEIRRVFGQYLLGTVLVVGLVVLAAWLGGLVGAVVTAFVLATAGTVYYEHLYAKAARAVRERLA